MLMSCAPVALCADVRPQVASALAEVETLMQQRDYEGAQRALREVELMRDLDGQEAAEVWNLYGSIYQAQGRYGRSIRAYETVLAQEGISNSLAARAARTLADLHAAQNNPAEALEYLNQWAALSSPATVKAERAALPSPGPRPTLSSPSQGAAEVSLSDQFVPKMDGFALPRYAEDFKAIVKVSPVYPKKAVDAGLEGYVVVECTVSKTGAVKNAKVAESSNSIFDRAAVRAVRQFKYRPRVVDGERVEVTGVTNRITFKLE